MKASYSAAKRGASPLKRAAGLDSARGEHALADRQRRSGFSPDAVGGTHHRGDNYHGARACRGDRYWLKTPVRVGDTAQ